MQPCSCACGLTGPATLTRGFLADFLQQHFDQLRSLHLVQVFDAYAKELMSLIFNVLLVELAFVDDTQDEAPLSLRACPAVPVVGRRSSSMSASIAFAFAVAWVPVA